MLILKIPSTNCKRLAKAKKLNEIESDETFPLLIEQKSLLLRQQFPLFPIEPLKDHHYFNLQENPALGMDLFTKGALGCLLVAGGQGTRAKFTQPKGLVPISNIKNKCFFQLFAEKTLAASHLAKKPLQLAIMTSPLNNAEIRSYFMDNNYFGLKEEQVDFFTQGMLPFLDNDGEIFFSSPGQIAKGPNGNGEAFKAFVNSGIWNKWQKKGISYINFIMIDNPLADPFDIALLDFHAKNNAELTLKCVERDNNEEKVGLIVKSSEHIKVIEYSEAPEKVFKDKETYPLANISLFLINMKTAFDVSSQKMPLHIALKPAIFYNPKTQLSETISAWKFEFFIFDILAFIKKVAVLVYPKSISFAPLKNADDVERVQQALLNRDRAIFQTITHREPPSSTFELDQQFYYPTEELKQKWLDQEAPKTPYITP